MPQMSPYNWLLMNLMFIMIFFMYMILCYYNYINKTPKLKYMDNLKPLNSTFILKW